MAASNLRREVHLEDFEFEFQCAERLLMSTLYASSTTDVSGGDA